MSNLAEEWITILSDRIGEFDKQRHDDGKHWSQGRKPSWQDKGSGLPILKGVDAPAHIQSEVRQCLQVIADHNIELVGFKIHGSALVFHSRRGPWLFDLLYQKQHLSVTRLLHGPTQTRFNLKGLTLKMQRVLRLLSCATMLEVLADFSSGYFSHVEQSLRALDFSVTLEVEPKLAVESWFDMLDMAVFHVERNTCRFCIVHRANKLSLVAGGRVEATLTTVDMSEILRLAVAYTQVCDGTYGVNHEGRWLNDQTMAVWLANLRKTIQQRYPIQVEARHGVMTCTPQRIGVAERVADCSGHIETLLEFGGRRADSGEQIHIVWTLTHETAKVGVVARRINVHLDDVVTKPPKVANLVLDQFKDWFHCHPALFTGTYHQAQDFLASFIGKIYSRYGMPLGLTDNIAPCME